jgi:2-keto-4-pentenoate hydratase
MALAFDNKSDRYSFMGLRSLKAGEIIMIGSFTRQFPIAPGDRIRTEFDGVGVVEVGMAR